MVDPDIRVLFSVLPVPLIAGGTSSGVPVGSSDSESVPRAGAGGLRAAHDIRFEWDFRSASDDGIEILLNASRAEHGAPNGRWPEAALPPREGCPGRTKRRGDFVREKRFSEAFKP